MAEYLPPLIAELKGAIGDFQAKMGEARGELDKTDAAAKSRGESIKNAVSVGLVAGGAAVSTFGAAVTKMAMEGEQDQARLEQAIKNTGGSYGEFSDRIDSTVRAMNRFGADNNETQQALAKLVNATHDTGKALDQMQTVADLAAAKHISLAQAAGLVAKVDMGKGTRTLAEFGLASADAQKQMDKLGKAAEDADKAVATSTDALGAATEKLNDLKERQAGKDKLTIADQQALRHANEDVMRATLDHNAALEKQAAAHARVQEATKNSKDSLTALTEAVRGNADAQANTLQGRIDAVRARFADMAETVGQKVGPALVAAGPAMAGIGGLMQSNLLPALAKGGGAFIDMAAKAATGAAGLIGSTVEMIASGVAWAASMIASAVAAAASWAVSMAGMIASSVAAGIGIMVPFLPIIAVVAAIGIAAYALYRNWDTVWGAIKAVASAVWDFLQAGFHALVDAFLNFTPLGQVIQHWSSIETFVRGLPARISDAARGMWDGIVNAFKAAMNLVIRGWNSLEFKIPGFDVGPVHFGGFTLGVPDIPYLAAGAILTKPTLFMGGEGGEPEAVVPLSKAGSMGFGDGGGGDLVLQVDGQAFARIAWRQLQRLKREGGQLELGIA